MGFISHRVERGGRRTPGAAAGAEEGTCQRREGSKYAAGGILPRAGTQAKTLPSQSPHATPSSPRPTLAAT